MQWAAGMARALKQERCILSICKITEMRVMVPLQVVYWLQPSNTFCFQVTHFESVAL